MNVPNKKFRILKFELASDLDFIRLLKKSSFPGCSKRARCKAPEILRSEACLAVRCNDQG